MKGIKLTLECNLISSYVMHINPRNRSGILINKLKRKLDHSTLQYLLVASIVFFVVLIVKFPGTAP